MKCRWKGLAALLLALSPVASFAAPAARTGADSAWVDPSLPASGRVISVVVSGKNAARVAAAVRACDGRVTTYLPVIGGVAALIPPSRVPILARSASVNTIVANKRTTAASWNGWVTDQRVLRGQFTFSAPVNAMPRALDSNGFVAVVSDGTLLFGNPDGSERIRVKLAGGPYNEPPIVTAAGILLTGEAGTVSLVKTDGSIVWTTSGISKLVKTNAVVGTNGVVYVVDSVRTVTALDLKSGARIFQKSLAASGGIPTATPAVGSDNSLYVTTDKGDVYRASADGAALWSLSTGFAITDDATLASDGSLLCFREKTLWAIDAATGSVRYKFTAASNIVAPPLVSAGTTFVPTSQGLYALTGTGAQRYYVTSQAIIGAGGSFTQSPVLSGDGRSLLLASGNALSSVDPATGTRNWTHILAGGVTAPVPEPEGGTWVGASNTLYHLRSDGSVSDSIALGGAAGEISPSASGGEIALQRGSKDVVFAGRVANQWNGKKDVTPGREKFTYNLANPVSIDIGADVVHATVVGAKSDNFIRGGDIGVAVVDSGVYWDDDTKAVLGSQLQHQFVGQADFVDPKCAADGGVQQPGYCFQDYGNSVDPYGHGSHVAGIVSNKLTDEVTGSFLGIAPDARIISVRVLGADGGGTYETVIRGIQWVIDNKSKYDIRVLNLSLSAWSTVPYFVDPLDIAVERAWQAGLVVVVAAGNTGPFAQTITVPGNDPYVITVGAVNAARTAGYWNDDVIPAWSATGPTYDGFPKPDILAPGSQIVSYMYNDPKGVTSAFLARMHPDYSPVAKLFRMNGTSMAAAVASGVVALMLDASPWLTPDQVKYRLLDTARPATDSASNLVYNTMQQGLGRIWAPDAVLGTSDSYGLANLGMDIGSDISSGYDKPNDLMQHYQGPVQRMISDDGTAYLYLAVDSDKNAYALGVSRLDGTWLDADAAARMTWAGARMTWAGGLSFTGNSASFASARMTWAGARMTWAGARMTWAGARMTWAGARMTWAGGLQWNGGEAWGSARMTWAGNANAYGQARMSWAGAIPTSAGASSMTWIPDDWQPPSKSPAPPPAGGRH